MHDIRKPYTRSSSNSNDLQSRVEQFENNSYRDDEREEYEDAPVQIPTRRLRRDVSRMDMYPRRRSTDRYEDEEVDGGDDRVRPAAPPRYRGEPRKRESLGTWMFIGTVLFIAVGALLLTYVFNSATITAVPKYKDVNDFRKAVVFTQDSENTVDIPFVVASSSISKSKTLSLSESKQVQAKASGKVIIYNNYSEAPQQLIKNTRLESTAGKIYRINQSVTVPGMKGSTPGALEVTVFADSYGSTYNTSATDFTIPGFKGSVREKGFYAKGKGAIAGGSSGNVSQASLSDLNAAKDELALELAQEIKASLIKVAKEGYIGLYGVIEIEYTDNQDQILRGGTGEYKVTGTGYLMLANAQKFAQVVARETIDYNNEPVRLGYTDTMTYTKKDTDHIFSTPTLSILAEGKPRVIWVNDIEKIKEMFKGKKRSDFKQMMKTIDAVESAEIGFSPLWLSNFPTNTDKIHIVESLPKR